MIRLHCDAPLCNTDAPALGSTAATTHPPPGWFTTTKHEGSSHRHIAPVEFHACCVDCHDILAGQLRTEGTP